MYILKKKIEQKITKNRPPKHFGIVGPYSNALDRLTTHIYSRTCNQILDNFAINFSLLYIYY